MARAQGSPCVCNHWLPDGEKNPPADRWAPRARLARALDEALADDPRASRRLCWDYVESKLFGIGSEEYVVGSAEFYAGYALSRGIGLCLDMGHYHPTETIHDKLSALLPFHRRLLLHLSRPVRWDSDHVVLFSDELRQVFLEVQRGAAWDRVRFATDFFDASLNRVAAYVIGLRAVRQALLYALLDPTVALQALEARGDRTGRLALMETMKTMPFGAVWAELCARADVPDDGAWLEAVRRYEARVLQGRR